MGCRGRVSAAITLALFAPQPLAHLAGAGAVNHVSFRMLYLVSGATTLSCAIWLAALRHQSGGNRRA